MLPGLWSLLRRAAPGVPVVRVAGLALLLLLTGASPGGAQPVPQDTADIANTQARTLFVRGLTQSYLEDYEEAVSLYERALQAVPNQPAILSAMAEAEARRDNLTSAIYYARQARANDSTVAHYHLELARLLEQAGQPEAAADAYQTLLSAQPSHAGARRALAQLWAERGRPERALRQYEALLDQTRRVEAGVYTEMLRLYRETDNEAGAERTLRTLIDRRHNPSVYRRMLGQLYARQDRYREAIPLFETLLSETPNDPSVLSQLKMMYLETGQPEKADRLGLQLNEESATPQQFVAQAQSLYEEAAALDSADTARILRLVRRALDQDPAHAPALDLLGTVRFEQGRYGQAAAAFERAVDENPRDPRRWQRAALAHLRADSVRQAAALAEEGRLLFPGRHELTGIEARAHLRLGAPETARARFRDALSELDSTATPAPERALLHAGLGRALHALGRPGEAARAVDTALRLAPRDATVLSVCARTLADRGESLDRALRYARRAVEVAPSTPEVLGTLGWVQLRRKQYAAARRAFEDALAAGTPDAWVYERFGDLHRALGHPDLARRYWQKALERSPTPDSLQQKLDTTPQSET